MWSLGLKVAARRMSAAVLVVSVIGERREIIRILKFRGNKAKDHRSDCCH